MRHRQVPRVLIGIQARSTSTRFPNKAAAMIGDKTMTEHVLHNVDESVAFLRRNLQDPVEFNVALLIPEGDPLKRLSARYQIVEGSEHDVLSRYQSAFSFYRPDYLVRLTADCPLLPDFVISKHIRSALYGNLDYITNGDPRFRTALDGHDCEVISKRLFRWVVENAVKPYDREHVSTLIKTDALPDWARVGNIIGYSDLSHIKLSVDTPEDLENVRAAYNKIEDTLNRAKTYRSNSVVFRL